MPMDSLDPWKHTQLVESVISTILTKTQSESAQVRKCAIETLASLVLEDYLKFRGSLLLYVLAATADKNNNIARLAHELIIKFANEKNAILIKSCLRECPFAFNDCRLVDNSEMFGSDLSLKSPLKSRIDDRQYIYRFLIHNLEVINCYMYFENFSTLIDRINKKNFQKTLEVLQSIADFLYICEHICKSKEMPKTRIGGGTEKLSDEEGETPTTSKAVDAATAASDPPKKKRKGQQTTLPEAMVVVEKTISRFPELSGTLAELDSSFKASFDQICYAIGEHFGDNIKYFPNLFWDKYRKAKQPVKRAKRRNENDDDESDELDANTSKLSKTPKRNVEPRSVVKARESVAIDDNASVNDLDTNTNASTASTSSKTPKRNAKEEQRILRKNVKSTVIDYSDSDSDDSRSTKTPKMPKTPRRNASEGQRSARIAIKNMVINDSDSDSDFESVSQSSTKSLRSFVKDKKRTTRRSKHI